MENADHAILLARTGEERFAAFRSCALLSPPASFPDVGDWDCAGAWLALPMTPNRTFLRGPGNQFCCFVSAVRLLSRKACVSGKTQIQALCRACGGNSSFYLLWSKVSFSSKQEFAFFLNTKKVMIFLMKSLIWSVLVFQDWGGFEQKTDICVLGERLIFLLLQNFKIGCQVSLWMVVKTDIVIFSLKYLLFCSREIAFRVVVWSLQGQIPLTPVQAPLI